LTTNANDAELHGLRCKFSSLNTYSWSVSAWNVLEVYSVTLVHCNHCHAYSIEEWQ